MRLSMDAKWMQNGCKIDDAQNYAVGPDRKNERNITYCNRYDRIWW
jgi:hypothetical protein